MTARRLHVLHVADATEGGTPHAVADQVRDQARRGWRVGLACPSRGALGYDAREAGAEVGWWDAAGLAGISRLAAIVARARPDVVHLHGDRAARAGRLAVRGRCPTVVEPHGWSPPVRALDRALERWTSELLLAGADEARRVEHHGLRTAVSVLATGLDLDAHPAADDRDRALARRHLGLAAAPTAVVVGARTRECGRLDVLAAWPRVRERVPGARLVVVGEGPIPAGLEGVALVGARTDVPAWLAAADVVVAPGRGPSRVALEAMAAARSVVNADDTVPALAGRVVAVDDEDALVDAVAARLADPELADGEGWHGRAHVELHHDLAATGRELARLYLRLVAARR